MNYLFIVLFALLSCNTPPPTQFTEAALNDTLTSLEGDKVSLKSILEPYKGKTVVIDIWASWCGDCIKGMPKVKTLQSHYKDAVYLFLSLDRSETAWKRGIKKYDVKGDHYFMHSGKESPFADFVKIDWIPRYMVINKEGNIEMFKAVLADDEKLIAALKK